MMDDVRERSVDDDTFPVVEDHIVPAAGDDTPSAWRRLVIYLSIPAALGIAYFLIHTAILHGGIQPHTVMEVLGIFLVLVVGIFAAVIIGKPASPVGKFPAMDDVVPAMEDATDSAVVDGPYLARRRSLVYWGLAAVLVMSYVVLRTSTWQGGAQLHTIMEVVATLLALMVTAMALVRFYSKKNNTFLFIGTGFLGTAFLDGYHAVVTSKFFAPYLPSDLPALIPWSWVASRQFLSVLLCLSWLAWVREQRLGKPGRISERTVYLTSGILTLASFLFFAFVPLPRAYYPEFIFHRPEEFLPAFFFLVALIGYLRKGEWRHDVFEHWLVLSLIVGFLGQTVFMSFSGQLFDMEFDAAHLLKKVSYVCVLTGLLVSMYSSFRRAEESTMILARAYGMLRTEIAEREHAEEALRGSEERLRAIVDNLVDGVITIDDTGVVQSFNPGAERIFGYAPDEVVGGNVRMLMPEPNHSRHDTYIADYLTTGEAKIIGKGREVEGRRRDGSIFPLELGIGEMAVGGHRMFTGIVRDITERKQAEATLARRAEELARSNADLEEFAYVASHDLQEPLRKVQSFGGRLQTKYGDALGKEGSDYVVRMRDAADRMQRLITDLLNFSRVTTQGQAFVPVDLARVAREVVSDLEVRIQETDGRVECSDLPTIDADPLQMHQLLQNLVANALKYRREDAPPVVQVSARIVEKDPPSAYAKPTKMCEIVVTDNGIGFEKQYADRIFGIFQRLHGRGKYEGTGVGLALCRKISERHGGTITAEGRPGEGATFTVTLPVNHPKIGATTS